MNASIILHTFLRLQSMEPSTKLPENLLGALGHSVVVTPPALERMSKIDVPYMLVRHGDVIEHEITGAIIAGEGGFLHEQIAFLNYQQGWRARAVLVMVTVKPRRSIFRYLWKRKMMNVVCLSGGTMYAYNPFNDTMFRVVGMDVSKALDQRWKDLYGYKVPLAMYNQKLSFRMGLGVSLGSGIDGSAMYELTKYWNMTVDVRDTGTSDHRIYLSNKMLYSGKADAATNARFVSRGSNEDDHLEYTTSIDGDSIVLILRLPQKLKGWDVFARIFEKSVWLSFLGTVILMNRVLLWVGKGSHWSYTIAISWRALCNVQITKLPKSTPERIVLASGLYIGLVMTTVFQASLFHFIKEEVRYEKMKTLLEVYNKTTVVCNTLVIKDFFRSSENDPGHWKHSILTLPLKDELLEKYALALRYKEAKLLKHTGEFRNDLYIMEEKINSFPLSYVVKRGSPYLEPLSEFSSKAFESGLSHIWYQMTIERVSQGKIKKPERVNRNVLTRKDIEVAFFALYFGLTCSFFVFILEMLTKCLYQRKLQGLRRVIRSFCNYMYPH